MKVNYLVIIGLVFSACAGCNLSVDTSTIPGTYIQYSELHHDEDSYTRLFDTLEIERLGKVTGENYKIIRRYKTFKTVDGKALEPEYKTRRWTANFREKSQTLMVNESGKVIAFYPGSNAIMLGGVAYKKMQ